MTIDDFRLTPSERMQPVWQKLEAYLNHRLERARRLNDQPHPEADTARLRGEIKALKGLIDLGKELPPAPSADGR